MSVVVLTSCGFVADLSMRSQLKRYRGDGVIYTCSNALMGGYGIDFPRFDAAQPFTATYHLSRVPSVPGSLFRPMLYLRHGSYPKDEIPPDDVKARLTAKFIFTVRDVHGEIAHAEIPLATSIWGSAGVYDLDKSQVHFHTDADYELQVEYSPGATPPRMKEFYVAVDGCAYY